MTTPDIHQYRLMTWLSPAFPVGAFSYSHGLETAVDNGLIGTADDLRTWIEGLLSFGSLSVDAALLRLTQDAIIRQDEPTFLEVAERAATQRGTSELALECTAQGRAFLRTAQTAWPDLEWDPWITRLARAEYATAYPVAVGLAAALADIPASAATVAFLHAGVANLISAGVRHIPLGQTQGQRTMALLESAVLDAADAAAAADLETLGSAAVIVDLCSARHETQTVRLFRS